MFTLKLLRSDADGVLQRSVSCPQYEVYEREYGRGIKTIVIYRNIVGLDNDGVEYHINAEPEQNDWNVCYVENLNGKTIDTIRPKQIRSAA